MENTLREILVVEDSEDDVFFLSRALKSAGIQNPIKIFLDGQAAINHVQSTTPRQAPLLMLLDLKLPRKNGFEVLEWIRKKSSFPNTVIVILTSSFESADVDRAYSLGANAYLTKVSDKESLLKIAFSLRDFWLQLNQFAVKNR